MSAIWRKSFCDSFLSKSEEQDYVPLYTSEDNKELEANLRPRNKYKWYTIYTVLLVSICMVGCGFIGFALGNRSWSSSNGRAKGFAFCRNKATVQRTDEGRLHDSAGRGQISNGV